MPFLPSQADDLNALPNFCGGMSQDKRLSSLGVKKVIEESAIHLATIDWGELSKPTLIARVKLPLRGGEPRYWNDVLYLTSPGTCTSGLTNHKS